MKGPQTRPTLISIYYQNEIGEGYAKRVEPKDPDSDIRFSMLQDSFSLHGPRP